MYDGCCKVTIKEGRQKIYEGEGDNDGTTKKGHQKIIEGQLL